MTRKPAQNHSIRSISGAVLLALGSAVMGTYAGIFAWRFEGTLNSSLGVCAGLGSATISR